MFFAPSRPIGTARMLLNTQRSVAGMVPPEFLVNRGLRSAAGRTALSPEGHQSLPGTPTATAREWIGRHVFLSGGFRFATDPDTLKERARNFQCATFKILQVAIAILFEGRGMAPSRVARRPNANWVPDAEIIFAFTHGDCR